MNAIALDRVAGHSDRVFFGGMGLVMISTAFFGFAPTYYLMRTDAPALTPLLHVHGLAATAWMVLYTVQVGLIASRRVDLHRRLVAIALVVSTTMASIVSRGFTEKLTFAAGAILMFVIYVVAGFLQRRRPGAHKRLMLLATITLLPPAIARMHLPFLPAGSVGPNLAGLVFLLPPFIYDWATLRRIHPALTWGSLFMVAMLPLRAWLQAYVF
jgi:hypothetical protein